MPRGVVEATFRVPFFALVDFAFARTFFAAIGPSSFIVPGWSHHDSRLTLDSLRMRRAGTGTGDGTTATACDPLADRDDPRTWLFEVIGEFPQM